MRKPADLIEQYEAARYSSVIADAQATNLDAGALRDEARAQDEEFNATAADLAKEIASSPIQDWGDIRAKLIIIRDEVCDRLPVDSSGHEAITSAIQGATYQSNLEQQAAA